MSGVHAWWNERFVQIQHVHCCPHRLGSGPIAPRLESQPAAALSFGSADTANPLAGLIQAGLQAYAPQMGGPAPRKSSGGSARADKKRSKKGNGRKRQPSSSSSGRSSSSSSVSGSGGGQFTEGFSRIELK